MANNSNPFSEYTKLFGDFKTPVSSEQAIAYFRRQGETCSAVIQALVEGQQEANRRASEILRSNAEHAMKASKTLMNNSSPENAASKQAEFAKTWLEYNTNAVRELAEITTKSLQEAGDIINKRVAEQMREFSDVATTSPKKKAA